MRRSIIVTLVVLWLCAAPAQAELRAERLTYRHGDTVLEGYLAYDDAIATPQPGVLVAHAWRGLGEYERRRADQLAHLGYVAFALDMYGKGIFAAEAGEAGRLSGKFKNDRALMRARATAGLNVLRDQPRVDASRIAAIGYCFGGTTVLELARSGASIAGVVSFHGGLDTPEPADARHITGKILALHGAADPFVPQEDVRAFQEEMTGGGVDWQLIMYGGAVHSFTDPGATEAGNPGARYDPKADRRSWDHMCLFFTDLFE